LTPEIHIEDVIEDDWNKLLAVTSDENAQTFSSFIQIDNDLKICDENAGEDENPEISVQEIEPTEPPVDKPSRANLLAAFYTIVKFSQPMQS
ncbi:Tigger transposable element-derived protein 6, partial [Aphis craccivora]